MLQIPAKTEQGVFLRNCIDLYEEMHREIKNCKNKNVQEDELVQACFEIAGLYKEKMIAAVRNHTFERVEDEILFFKQIKPLFHAEVEFYTYCYHIILFKTVELEADKNELRNFYKRQLQRKEKLKKENPVFYEYVQERNTYADAEWFTRHNNSRDSSLFDALMGKYLALEKFEDYLRTIMATEC
ncbi:RteC protein [Lacibacter cauensis]|uniref:RteC protein n=1 Tax=Lacibacter cauensis TaxID=510947 RepID=A0A562SX24_9BACT|nr:RteC domain-containing protein [Lacibacter cauensis]TWI85845.1 RteC protein [Lacibacter cauensis]